ncbi:hypothetical protein M422DRAFT_59357 [Sphaerobolus stellatus SS14]|nr:hypothetical protein M422DRAFT_59357 [Sphaerobolus stellatus SS14]
MSSHIVNIAHAQSEYTCLAFSRDGSRIYTGGEEGFVRIWQTELGGDQEPDLATEGEDAITCVASSNEKWFSGCLDSCVRVYDTYGSSMETFLTRAVAVPIRSIAVDAKSERVAVASDELEVKLIDLKDSSNIQKLEGHKKGVRAVTWHPSGTILTTSGCDGDIIVWDVTPGKDPKILETISGVIPAADPESKEFVYNCSAVWHPSGKYFIVSTRAHELIAISKDDWKKTFSFSDDDVTGVVTALGLSSNGLYLAAATAQGIFIWSTTTRKVLVRHIPDSFVTVSHLAFSPNKNLLAWTDAEGILTRWPQPLPSSYADPVEPQGNVGSAAKKRRDPLGFDDDEEPAAGDKDADGEDDYGLGDDDWMIDDLGILDKDGKEKEKREDGNTKELVSVTKAQPAFQPGSTPMVNRKRYLAFNMLGVIEVTDQDTHNVVNVDFHDRTTRPSSHFQDSHKCNIASLGERGALYACPPDAGHPSQIMYRPYSGWSSTGDWQFSLPEGETVVALTAGGEPPSSSLREKSADGNPEGNGNVVVATTKGYLRFFTGGGIQRYIWTLAADVVSMVAGREWVFVVHRDGGTSLDGCQNLSYTLISWDTFTVVQNGRLPLPRGSTLAWIGISEEGAPTMYDSNGLLSILDKFRRPHQARWVPLLDATTLGRREGKDESYWPVGVSATTFMCIILKGRETYPGFPRPLIQDLEVQIPLFNLDLQHHRLEEKFLREELHVGFLRDALGGTLTDSDIAKQELALDKEIIQMIQMACKADKLQRALDAAALFHHTTSFDMAIKVADFYRLGGLQEKLQMMKQERESRDRFAEERDSRLGWARDSAPIPAPLPRAQFSNKPRFEEFSSTTSIRKSLAPAKPIQSSRHDRDDSSAWAPGGVAASVAALRASEVPESSPWDTSFDEEPSFSSVPETKRKRDDAEFDDVQINDEGSAQKKRALQPALQPANPVKTSGNPFARKAAAEAKANPFARPAGAKSHVATKSNSFFEKVDEANDHATQVKSKSNGKSKNKGGMRQTTLFDLDSVAEKNLPEKKARGRPKTVKTSEEGAESGTSTPIETQDQDAETQKSEDVNMVESPLEQPVTEPVDNDEADEPVSPSLMFSV